MQGLIELVKILVFLLGTAGGVKGRDLHFKNILVAAGWREALEPGQPEWPWICWESGWKLWR